MTETLDSPPNTPVAEAKGIFVFFTTSGPAGP